MKKLTKEELNELKPTVWVGKNKLSEQIFNEINLQLKTKGYIKVKILKIIRNEFEQIINQILSNTNSELVDKRGLTFILKKTQED